MLLFSWFWSLLKPYVNLHCQSAAKIKEFILSYPILKNQMWHSRPSTEHLPFPFFLKIKKEINKSLRHKLLRLIKITINIIIYLLNIMFSISVKLWRVCCLDTFCFQYLLTSVLGILPGLSGSVFGDAHVVIYTYIGSLLF